jgi:hypothetical protein
MHCQLIMTQRDEYHTNETSGATYPLTQQMSQRTLNFRNIDVQQNLQFSCKSV